MDGGIGRQSHRHYGYYQNTNKGKSSHRSPIVVVVLKETTWLFGNVCIPLTSVYTHVVGLATTFVAPRGVSVASPTHNRLGGMM
jgi:hypothetical protein